MSGFVKLYGSILTSSVWAESKETRLVWITMLTLADKDGRVEASIPGLAHAARVTVPECEAALATFKAPDQYSRTKDNDGRRIEDIDGGWFILNHEKYRELRTDTQVKTAERQKRFRERHREGVTGNASNAPDADANTDTSPPSTADDPGAVTDNGDQWQGIVATLRVPPVLQNDWAAMLCAMTEGLGTPNMKPVSWEILREAALELATQSGDYTANRYKAFVAKVLSRRARAHERAPPRKSSDKASRGVEALGEWLKDDTGMQRIGNGK